MKLLFRILSLVTSLSVFAEVNCEELKKIEGTYEYNNYRVVLSVDGCKLSNESKNGTGVSVYDGANREFSKNSFEQHEIISLENDNLFDILYYTLFNKPALVLNTHYSGTTKEIYSIDLDGNKHFHWDVDLTYILDESGDLELHFKGFDDNGEVMSTFSHIYKKL